MWGLFLHKVLVQALSPNLVSGLVEKHFLWEELKISSVSHSD